MRPIFRLSAQTQLQLFVPGRLIYAKDVPRPWDGSVGYIFAVWPLFGLGISVGAAGKKIANVTLGAALGLVSVVIKPLHLRHRTTQDVNVEQQGTHETR
jgi:hypothetical protein